MLHETDNPNDEQLQHHLLAAQHVFQLRTCQRYRERHDRQCDRRAPGQYARNWVRRVVLPGAADGRGLRLVHVVTGPVNPGAAFEVESYRSRFAAREDIRVIGVPVGSWPRSLPQHYVVLCDDVRADVHHDEAGQVERIVLTDDALQVEQARQWAAAALGRSRPYPSVWV